MPVICACILRLYMYIVYMYVYVCRESLCNVLHTFSIQIRLGGTMQNE